MAEITSGARATDSRGQPLQEPAPGERPGAGTLPWMSTVVASAAGLSAYLALLGGTLLAIRFWHAGLPVTQAVGEVPLATLVTTALVELFVPLIFFTFVALLGGLMFAAYQRGRQQVTKTKERGTDSNIFIKAGLLVGCGLTLPLGYWSLTVFLILAVLLFSNFWLPRIIANPSRARILLLTLVVVLLASSLPVLVRQTVEPLNMERVRIERPGQKPLVADLVAFRDNSIVVARCHHLVVMPMPASVTVIEGLPSQYNVAGHSVLDLLGIKADSKVAPRPMPC